MTKNSKTVAMLAITVALVVVLAFLARDLWLRSQPIVSCPDGSHPTIDIRNFTTQYWAYSVKLEASVEDKAKLSTQLDPKTLGKVSEGLQEAKEFRKYIVAGYNSCAITQAQYAGFGAQFQALDRLAYEINSLLSKPALSNEESAKVAGLISQYGDLVRQLGPQSQ
jgi:hypothetical protein